MIGVIIGDVVGSRFEFDNYRATDFELFDRSCRFTDDTVMVVATAYALMNDLDFATTYREFGKRYPKRGYGGYFREWLVNPEMGPYNSYGNGSAMRIGPVGEFFKNETDVLAYAIKSAQVTHNHPEGLKGAQAIAHAVFLAKKLKCIKATCDFIASTYKYAPDQSIANLRFYNHFAESCQETIPVVLSVLKLSNSFEDAIRNAVSVGGDTDTICAIVGAVAEQIWIIPKDISDRMRIFLPEELLKIVDEFDGLVRLKE